MNPGLVIKLRPNGPWRIGPDSGARNRVDAIYHSDSLYSAVTSAMARLGWLEEWLDATARNQASAVCFSSCFPFLDEIGFVVPPRTIWPPTSPGLMSARVRWKSARFVPLGIVQAILAGQRLDENHWSVDGASECLVPAGRPGPFRSGVRWSAAVDRLSGASERHSTACIEFRPGAGLWTIASFADEAARDRWADRVKAAFRLLADSGFGGERSRGWGRSEAPEFVEGLLPDMLIAGVAGQPVEEPAAAIAPVEEPAPEPPTEPVEAEAGVLAPPVIEPLEAAPSELPPDPEPEPPAANAETPIPDPNPSGHEPVPPTPEPPVTPAPEATGTPAPEPATTAAPERSTEPPAPETIATPAIEPAVTAAPEPPSTPAPEATLTPAPEPPSTPAPEPAPVAAPEAPVPPDAPEPEPSTTPTPNPQPPLPAFQPPPPVPKTPAYWLLSVYVPAQDDSIDWTRGNYSVVTRGGRIDSPAGTGELKKQIHVVAEGSVLHAASEPRGSAADVAPDGFPHPVFRAGFAVSIRLPEVS